MTDRSTPIADGYHLAVEAHTDPAWFTHEQEVASVSQVAHP